MTKIESPQKLTRDGDSILRNIVRSMIRSSGKGQDRIASELADLGYPTSVNMLNAYTAESKRGARFPATLIEPLSVITGDDRLQRLIVGVHLRKLLELGECISTMVDGQVQKQLLTNRRRERKGKRR